MILKNKYLIYLFSFLMLIFIFISAIEIACFDMRFYDSQHQKLTLYNQKINEYIGITEEELSDVTKYLLDYIQDNEDTLDYQLNIKGVDREVFNDKEKAHMVDVKNLYLNVNTIKSIIQIFTTFLLFYLLFNRKKLSLNLFKEFNKASIIFIAIFAILVMYILVDFNTFWNNFHHIFFSNDLWLLDLRSDILIMIVPPEFFNNLCLRIVLYIVVLFAFVELILFVLTRYLFND